jgi:hypothetical protein
MHYYFLKIKKWKIWSAWRPPAALVKCAETHKTVAVSVIFFGGGVNVGFLTVREACKSRVLEACKSRVLEVCK